MCLVLESISPWLPGIDTPPKDAKIAWVSIDPVQSRFKTMEFRADLWIAANSGASLRAIYEAATGMLDKSDMSRIEERKQRLLKKKQELFQRDEALAVLEAAERQGLRRRYRRLFASALHERVRLLLRRGDVQAARFALKNRGIDEAAIGQGAWRPAREPEQMAAAERLGINQPKVSALRNYKLEGFSVERLMTLLTTLDQDVEIVIRKKPRSRAAARISVVAA